MATYFSILAWSNKKSDKTEHTHTHTHTHTHMQIYVHIYTHTYIIIELLLITKCNGDAPEVSPASHHHSAMGDLPREEQVIYNGF